MLASVYAVAACLVFGSLGFICRKIKNKNAI